MSVTGKILDVITYYCIVSIKSKFINFIAQLPLKKFASVTTITNGYYYPTNHGSQNVEFGVDGTKYIYIYIYKAYFTTSLCEP